VESSGELRYRHAGYAFGPNNYGLDNASVAAQLPKETGNIGQWSTRRAMWIWRLDTIKVDRSEARSGGVQFRDGPP